MPSPLRFRLPVQGEGIDETGIGVEWSHVYQLGGDANGLTKWSRQKLYTGFSHDSEFLMVLRNRGSGGRHFLAQKSTDGSTVVQITDTGLSLTALAASGQITSTVATGTAPFIVASTTVVNNLNVNYLEGHGASDFALAADLDDYVLKSGDTITGDLDITGELAVNGNTALGNSATDVTTVTGDLTVTNDVQIGNLTNGSFLVGTQTLWADPQNNRVGIGTNSPNALYVFDVNGDVRFQDLLTVGGFLVVSDQATFGDDVLIAGATTISDTLVVTEKVTIGASLGSGDTAIQLTGNAVIDFDLINASGFTTSTWSGYIRAKAEGVEIEIPYRNH